MMVIVYVIKARKISSINSNVAIARSINIIYTFKAQKVLVAMIGISKYNSDILPNLIGAWLDYCIVKNIFNVKYGYHTIYTKQNIDNNKKETERITKRIKKINILKISFN